MKRGCTDDSLFIDTRWIACCGSGGDVLGLGRVGCGGLPVNDCVKALRVEILKGRVYLFFFTGGAASSAIRSLLEDMVGQQGMLEATQNQWADPIVTVPLALLVLIAAFVMAWTTYVSMRQEELNP